MEKNIDYYMKIQNSYNTTSKKEYNIARLNSQINKHFTDSIDYEVVLKNGISFEIIIEKTSDHHTKKAKVKNTDTINMGDIIDWCNAKWLVTSVDIDVKTFKRVELKLCTFLLRWQNSSGATIERWCVDKNSTGGLDENKIITTSNSKFDLQLTLDDESKVLKIDKRFLYDVVGVDIPNAYILTDRNIATDNYQYMNRGGVLNLTITKNLYNSTTDNKTLMIADYFSPTISPPDQSGILLYSKIVCSNPSNQLSLGGTRTLTPTFYDNETTINTIIVANWTYEYPVGFSSSDFVVTPVVGTNKIKVKVLDNEKLLGKVLKVSVSDGSGGYVSSIELTITA